jgi:hypothetical protein
MDTGYLTTAVTVHRQVGFLICELGIKFFLPLEEPGYSGEADYT